MHVLSGVRVGLWGAGMSTETIILKPGIPGVSRPAKQEKNPVRHVPKDSQEWRIIEQRVLREVRQ